MSRIYQGGSAQRIYQSNQGGRGFQPITVQGESKKISEAGQAAIDDLKTLDRERRREEEMSSLEQGAADRAAQLDLEVEQKAEAAQLRLTQMKEKAQTDMSHLGEKNALKIQQTFDKASFDLNQTVARTDLKSKQTAAKGNFDLKQTGERVDLKRQQSFDQASFKMDETVRSNEFQNKQTADKYAFERQQLTAQHDLKREQLFESNAMAMKFSEDNLLLGIEARGQQAQFQVDRAHLQAKQAVQKANQSAAMNAVSQLVNFAVTTGTHFYNEHQKEQAEQERLQEQLDLQNVGYVWSEQGQVVAPDGTPNPVIEQQHQLQAVEQAEEAAIAKVSQGNPIQAENIRQPLADATMDRDLRQTSVGDAALAFAPQYQELISNPETRMMVGGVPKTLAEVRSRPEVQEWLQNAAAKLTSEFGIVNKDVNPMVVQYATAVRKSVNTAYATLAPQVAAMAKQERVEASMGNAANLMATGNHQEAYNVARNGYITSGQAFGKTNKQINDATFQELLKAAPDPTALANVQKIPGQAGTEFGKQPEYAKMIQAEQISRLKAQNQTDAVQSTYNNNRISEIMYGMDQQLSQAKNGEESAAIRMQTIQELQALVTPNAMDEIAKLSKPENMSLNMNVYSGLMERATSGVPPSSTEVIDAHKSGEISFTQMQAIIKTGELGDRIDQRIKETGIPDGEKYMGAEVRAMLMNGRVGGGKLDGDSARGLTQTAVAAYAPEFDARLKEYVVANREATRQDIIQEAQKIRGDLLKQMYDPSTGEGAFSYNSDTRTVDFDPPHFGEGRVVARINPVTGEAQRDYSHVDSNKIPQGASQRDVYLNKDDYLRAREAWQNGEVKFSPRINNIANKLGLSPRQLVEQQTLALGYPKPFLRAPTDQGPSGSEPMNMRDGMNALQVLGVPERGAAYLSGNIQQESSWDGMRSWPQVMGDGTSRNGGLVSWASWANDPARLGTIEKYLGKSIEKATHTEQLAAMMWEMRGQYPDQYRIFMNPNATDTQLRRASRAYWGYGHEGKRYQYAQQLLNS